MAATRDFPNMRFETGEVLIKLSPSRRDWLLLDRSTLVAASPVLKNMLDSTKWTRPEQIFHPTKNEKVDVYKLVLRYQRMEGTFLLESGDHVDLLTKQKLQSSDCLPFFAFQLADVFYQEDPWSGDWQSHYEGAVGSMTIADFKFFFCALLDLPASLDTLAPGEGLTTTKQALLGFPRVFTRLLNVTAISEYHLATETVGSRVEKALLAHPHIWKAAAVYPKLACQVAYVIRSRELYAEVARHLLGSSDLNDSLSLQCCSETLGFSENELVDLFADRIRDAARQKDEIIAALDTLQLFEVELPTHRFESNDRSMRRRWVSFTSAMRQVLPMVHSPEDNYSPNLVKAEAHAAYGQWWMQQKHGSHIAVKSAQATPLVMKTIPEVCYSLIKCRRSSTPTAVFGKGLAQYYALLRGGYASHQYARDFDTELTHILDQAATKIKEIIADLGSRKRGEFAPSVGYENEYRGPVSFLYFDPEEMPVPWAEEAPWVPADSADASQLVSASEAWLETLGVEKTGRRRH